MKTWAIATLSAIAVIVVLITVFLVPKMISNHGLNTRLEAIESSVAPPSGWKKIKESRHPSSLLCFTMDSRCPSSYQTYEVDELTPEELVSVAPQAHLTVEGDCLPQGNEAGQSTSCTADGIQDEFLVHVSVVSLSGGRMEVVVGLEFPPTS